MGASESAPDITLESSFIDGMVLPLGGAVARLFLERPPPVENVAERHLDFDLGANTFMKINSLQNVSLVRSIIAEVHWEALARYGMKLLGNSLTREEYLDAVGFGLGLTMSLTHHLNGTVLLQDVSTTAKKYVANFLKAYLLMSNQYYSFMDHSIAWLADDIAAYASEDVLRIRDTSAASEVRQEWNKYAAEANKGLRSLRLISLSLLLSYRNVPTEVKFQPADTLIQIVPPSWMAIKYLLPAV
ncbi:uncharacterized protein LOC129593549 isoform X2 [Paramacrobiotus metropolitanus]|nr:uncharacterized protein LOC129593549 isoform X2 [Paramacrobiotus metropolitanus]